MITLDVQNTWHKGLWWGFIGSDKSQYLQFWLPKSLLQNPVQFFSNKTTISDGTLWCHLSILLPSGSRKEAGRRMQSYICIGSGIPGFDSSSVESCQADSCPDVFECSVAVSAWIISQQLCGMQSPPLEMTLCWDLRLFAALFLPQVLYSQLPHTWIAPFVLSPFSFLAPTHFCFFWLQLNLYWTTQAYACYWAQDCPRVLQELHMTCMALVNEEFCIGT